MSSNWPANSGQAARERFAGPLVISGLVAAGLLLLVVLYPEKTLLKLLSAQEVSSPAQLSYLEALIRLRTNDSNLALVLARNYLASGSPVKALKALDHLQEPLPPGIRKTERQMRYQALRQRLGELPAGSAAREQTRRLYAGHVELMVREGAGRPEIEAYLADALHLGDQVSVAALKERLTPPAVPAGASRPATPESAAAAALARGDYRGAAAIYFSIMHRSGALNQQRRYFLAAVRTLQSGNLPAEALAAGDSNMDGLEQDREALLFMARLALAANRPDRSQIYIRRALGMSADKGGES